MKNIVLLLMLLGLGLSSCQKEEEVNSPKELSLKGDFKTYTFNDSIHYHMLSNSSIIKQIGKNYFLSDDLLISERQFNILSKIEKSASLRTGLNNVFSKRWTNGIVYYKIESTRIPEIHRAFDSIENNSVIKFIERTSQNDYVIIKDGPSGESSFSNHLGMESGYKEIVLDPTQNYGTIIHELMHSLGFLHEHKRPDRNSFVNVDLNQIPHPNGSQEYIQQAYQYSIDPVTTTYGTFDFNSIMLYGPSSILSRVGGGSWNRNRDSLSTSDKNGLAKYYGSKITGPISTCNEVTFTILYADNVSLQNATGIATLTSLGNNRYKVTRTGTANGIVSLTATNPNNVVTSKNIEIGSKTNFSIISQQLGTLTNMQFNTNYTLEVLSPSSGETYNWTIYGATIISGQGTSAITIKTPFNPFLPYETNVSATVTVTNACGSSTKSQSYLLPASTGGGGGNTTF